MKKFIKIYLNKILNLIGIQTIPIYELKYINEKHREAVDEYVSYLIESLFNNINENLKRNELLTKLYGTSVGEALYIIDCLDKVKGVRGDVCEFGIANGSTSALIANEIITGSKKLWLYDSFQGLSKPTKEDELIDDIFNLGSMEKYESSMSYPVSYAKAKLKALKFPKTRTKFIHGFIEDTIFKNLPDKISFAYIDFDLYLPTKVTLEHLNKRLSKGGFVVVDDYNFFSRGVKKAVDDFIDKNKKYKLILPKKFAGKFCIIHKLK